MCHCAICMCLRLTKEEHDRLCLSRVQAKHSYELSKKHMPGKVCKEKNQCSVCAFNRYIQRVLRHISGGCKGSRNCEACYEEKHGRRHLMVHLFETSPKAFLSNI